MTLQPPYRSRRLAENIFSLYALQGLTYVLPVLVLPYLVRTLGMEVYGLTAFAQSFAQYFNVLTDYGFGFSATRTIAQNRADRDRTSRIFCSVLVVKLLLFAFGAVLLILLTVMVPRFHQEAAFFLVAFMAVFGNVLFPVWYFQGIEEMRYIAVATGIARLVSSAALFVFVHHPSDGLLALAIQAAGTLAAGTVGLTIALRKYKIHIRRPALAELRTICIEGWNLFVSNAAISLYTNTNVFLVGLIGGNIQAGYFSATEKLIRAMNGLIAPLAQAIFPHISLLAKQAPEAAVAFLWRTLRWMSGLAAIPSVLLLIFSSPVASLCFGDAAAGSAPIIRWIALMPMLIAVSNILGVQTMLTFGLDKQFSRILLVAGVVNLALAPPLIFWRGAQGAGMSVLFTEAFVTLAMIAILRDNQILTGNPHKAAVA